MPSLTEISTLKHSKPSKRSQGVKSNASQREKHTNSSSGMTLGAPNTFHISATCPSFPANTKTWNAAPQVHTNNHAGKFFWLLNILERTVT